MSGDMLLWMFGFKYVQGVTTKLIYYNHEIFAVKFSSMTFKCNLHQPIPILVANVRQ